MLPKAKIKEVNDMTKRYSINEVSYGTSYDKAECNLGGMFFARNYKANQNQYSYCQQRGANQEPCLVAEEPESCSRVLDVGEVKYVFNKENWNVSTN